MSFWEKLYNFFDYQLEEAPSSYGLFHLLFFLAVVVFTVVICKLFVNADDKTVRKLTAIIWIIMVVFELYKELNYSFSFENGTAIYDYQWYIFPFQFCSTPLYVLPLVAFLPNCKARDALIAFSGTFALFGGLTVLFYPEQVFIKTLGICIQSFVHHGLQSAIGVFFTVRSLYHSEDKKHYFSGACITFSAFIAASYVINIIGHYALVANGNDETFNMFYISPFHETTLPLLSLFNGVLPYPFIPIIYCVVFVLAAFVVYMIHIGFYRLYLNHRKGNKLQNAA